MKIVTLTALAALALAACAQQAPALPTAPLPAGPAIAVTATPVPLNPAAPGQQVVRDGVHEYHSKANHQVFQKSLTKTCMKCHENKDQFCDKCHATVSVNPYCWDCHVDPKGVKK